MTGMVPFSARARILRTLGGWLIGGALAGFTILPICDLSFDCGCMQGFSHCDIHMAGMPDCPWCTALTPFAPFVLSMLFSYTAGLVVAWLGAKTLPFPWVPIVSGFAVVIGAIVAGMATAVLTGRPVLPGL